MLPFTFISWAFRWAMSPSTLPVNILGEWDRFLYQEGSPNPNISTSKSLLRYIWQSRTEDVNLETSVHFLVLTSQNHRVDLQGRRSALPTFLVQDQGTPSGTFLLAESWSATEHRETTDREVMGALSLISSSLFLINSPVFHCGPSNLMTYLILVSSQRPYFQPL